MKPFLKFFVVAALPSLSFLSASIIEAQEENNLMLTLKVNKKQDEITVPQGSSLYLDIKDQSFFLKNVENQTLDFPLEATLYASHPKAITYNLMCLEPDLNSEGFYPIFFPLSLMTSFNITTTRFDPKGLHFYPILSLEEPQDPTPEAVTIKIMVTKSTNVVIPEDAFLGIKIKGQSFPLKDVNEQQFQFPLIATLSSSRAHHTTCINQIENYPLSSNPFIHINGTTKTKLFPLFELSSSKK
jgi:hypothetical protein